MSVSVTASLLMVITASLMWGSWFQFLRRIGDWPVPSFMLWLYTTSFVVIAGCVLLLEKWFIPGGIVNTLKAAPELSIFTFVCGMLFCVSTQIQMMVVSKAGLIFFTSISAMCSIPYGFLITSYFGGIPDTVSMPLLLTGVCLVFTAGLLCQQSTRMRDRNKQSSAKADKARIKYILIILFCVFVLGPSYTLAMSIAPQTAQRPNGLPPVLLVGVLSAGSLLGTWILSGIRLTLSKQWKETFSLKNKRYILYACIAGVCHYGGNLIHTIGIPSLSMSIAWPIGNLASFWQYMWGIKQGEYRNAEAKTKTVFALGVGCYIAALVVLTMALYG